MGVALWGGSVDEDVDEDGTGSTALGGRLWTKEQTKKLRTLYSGVKTRESSNPSPGTSATSDASVE